MKDKHKARENLLHKVDTPEQEEQGERDRRKTLITTARHSFSAVDFVLMVEALGLEDELEERIQGRPELQTAVTKARQAAATASVLTSKEY